MKRRRRDSRARGRSRSYTPCDRDSYNNRLRRLHLNSRFHSRARARDGPDCVNASRVRQFAVSERARNRDVEAVLMKRPDLISRMLRIYRCIAAMRPLMRALRECPCSIKTSTTDPRRVSGRSPRKRAANAFSLAFSLWKSVSLSGNHSSAGEHAWQLAATAGSRVIEPARHNSFKISLTFWSSR